ncbi:MAG: hypothetical protein CVT88_00225 [Candidatus Altiarchaeales archaeon HGW-Altiarchaeales-1]|nr:MAG: hypothetical protein CVT88_00225 [Candidatus Altiarchaeales archaeon HGW-Altiarchaeales-1]
MDEIYAWMNSWSNKKIKKDKNFKELITYEGVSLWWFADRWLRENDMYLTKLVSVQQIINYLNDPKNEINNKTGDEINRELSEKFLKDININKIKLTAIYHLINLKQYFRYYYLKIFKRNSLIEEKLGGKKILIISESGCYRTKIDPITKKESKIDEYFEPIIKELKRRDYTLKVIDVDFTPKINLNDLREKNAPSWGFYEQYLNKTISLKVNCERKKLEELWKKLKVNKEFINSFDYEIKNKKINIYPYLKDSFSAIFKYRFPEAVKRIETIKRMIEIETPDLVLLQGEADSFGRCAVTAAKLRGIPVVAILHGLLSPYNCAYMHSKDDISSEGSIKYTYCPIPDKTAVYGPCDTKTLTEIHAYPEDSVIVTGQPRYDSLARAKEIYNKEKTFEKLNLDKNKRLIVWATNSYIFNESSKKDIYAVFDSIKKISDDFQLIIKKHPGYYMDDSVYNKIYQEKFGIHPLITKEADTSELLYASDLVIIEDSTVGIEAIILGKPVIRINFSGHQEVMPYVSSGAALGCYKEEDLIIDIKKALYDKETKEKLKNAREKFSYEYAYLPDGKATERVCNLIEEMIKESKK